MTKLLAALAVAFFALLGSSATAQADFCTSHPNHWKCQPPPPPPPPPPSGADPSGVPAPVGDISGWRQLYVDNFPTDVPLGSFPAAVNGKWGCYGEGWPDTVEKSIAPGTGGRYSCPKTTSVSGGVLDLWLHTEGITAYVSAPTPRIFGPSGDIYEAQGQTYGRYAMRWRADLFGGYKSANLLWPLSNVWPGDGEIDFPEVDPFSTGQICAFSHWSNGGQDAYCAGLNDGAWHTSVIEWLPGSVKFYLDGALLGNSVFSVPSKPMRWVLQNETSIADGRKPFASEQGHAQFDWVAAYAPA